MDQVLQIITFIFIKILFDFKGLQRAYFILWMGKYNAPFEGEGGGGGNPAAVGMARHLYVMQL